MAEEATSDENPVTFNIKTAGDTKYSVTVPLSMSVSGLKDLLSSEQYAGLPAARQRLIYSGRVLKDGDSLARYKIKEGTTVHMVKTAESNTRNQPGGSSSTTQASTGSTPQQLPSMAAGTGANNLLAGLTGARFAGLAQLPNQSMFGPDGGMGAPPDSEEALRRLEDPEVRRQLNEALSNPDVIEQLVRQNPMFSMLRDPNIRSMLTSPEMIRQNMNFRRAMGARGGPGGGGAFQAPGGVDSGEGAAQTGTGPTGQPGSTEQAPPNPFASMFGMPGGAGAGADNPFAALMNPAMFGAHGNAGEGEANREGDSANAPPNPFGGGNPFANPYAMNMMRDMMANPEFMQRMMQSMFGGPQSQNAGGGGAGGGNADGNREGQSEESTTGGQSGGNAAGQGQMPPNPFANLFGGGLPGGAGGNPFAAFGDMGAFGQPAAPPDNRPPEERYADQLRQLNDMGFFDFDRNIEALRRSGGSVQGAVNHLLGG